MDELAQLLGESPAINLVREKLRQIVKGQPAGRRLPAMLIQGETGTGKGLVARIIHRMGPRRGGPFVDINCPAIPETLLEAELFGFERGAFTDARQAKPGLFQTAHGGTLFLDEVGLLPESVQAKLLTAIEERSVRRLGSTQAESVDACVISATNSDLRAALRERRFRDDLYHRLSVITLDLPALRDRDRDVLLLAERFLARTCADYGLAPKRLDAQAQARLLAYAWPGNIRELANVIERAALFAEPPVITGAMLGPLEAERPSPVAPVLEPITGAVTPEEAMRQYLETALEEGAWNISRTAARLGIARNTLYARLEKYGVRGHRPLQGPSRRPNRPEPAPAPAPTATHVQWERRGITLLRAALNDPEDVDAWSQTSRALDIIIDKLQTFGGRIEELTPGGILASFGVDPVDDPSRRAAHAAIVIHKGAARAGESMRRTLGVKIGIDVAHLPVRRSENRSDIDADAMRARWSALDELLQSIEPDMTVVSAAAAPFLDRRFELVPINGGKERADPLYRLTGHERRGLGLWGAMTQFVGRHDEIEALRGCLAAARSGQGQLMAVVGEPGVGKSRLIWEFIHSSHVDGWLVLQVGAVPYGKTTPYLPAIELLKAYCGIGDRDDQRAIREKVVGKLLALDPAFEVALPAFLTLLDLPVDDRAWQALDPAGRRRRTLDALKRLLLRESQVQPLLVIFEDLHWIDGETQALLDGLVNALGSARLLLLVNYRPEYQHTWGSKTHYVQLRLEALPAENAGELLDTLLGDEPGLAPLKALLVKRGNPFFLEEIVRTLVETKALVGERGRYRTMQPVQAIQIPPTVQTVLAARIDRLGPEDKRLLQTAAVIGKDVPYPLLAAIAELDEGTLRAGLARLQEAEFLYEVQLFPELEHTFKHALTHEVAYGTLPGERRRVLHAGLVGAIERLYAGRLEEQVERLAAHASLGGMAEAAVRYFRQAAVRARQRFAYHQRVRFLEQALAQAAGLPDGAPRTSTIRDLFIEMGQSLVGVGETERAAEACQRALRLAEESGDAIAIARAALPLAYSHYMSGRAREAIPHAERARAILAPRGPSVEGSQALYVLGRAHRALGNFVTAREEFESAIAPYETGAVPEGISATPTGSSVDMRAQLEFCLMQQGEYHEAARVHEGLQRVAALPALRDDAGVVLYSHLADARLALEQGEFERADHVSSSALRLCREWQYGVWVRTFTLYAGRAAMFCGRLDDAVRLLEEARQLAPQWMLICAVWLADAYACAGRVTDARAAAEEALAHARARGERPLEADALQALAELDARDERAGEAQATACYRGALALAEELGMRPLVAHCHAGLGKLYRRAGKRQEAQEHLTTAATMYREMGMTYWLEKAEAELRELA